MSARCLTTGIWSAFLHNRRETGWGVGRVLYFTGEFETEYAVGMLQRCHRAWKYRGLIARKLIIKHLLFYYFRSTSVKRPVSLLPQTSVQLLLENAEMFTGPSPCVRSA